MLKQAWGGAAGVSFSLSNQLVTFKDYHDSVPN